MSQQAQGYVKGYWGGEAEKEEEEEGGKKKEKKERDTIFQILQRHRVWYKYFYFSVIKCQEMNKG